jgi:tetratricopeptide (TPR) repeat protein
MIAALLLSLALESPATPPASRGSSAAATGPARRATRSASSGAPARDPYEVVQEAKAALDRGEFQRVLALVDPLLKRYPRSQSSHLLRAMALDGLRRFDEAERAYRAALASAPDDPQYHALFGQHFMRREAWGPAIRELELSVKSAPSADSFFYLAQACFHTDNKARALEAIERSAELAPTNPTILLKLGEYRAQAGKHQAALEGLQRAQKLNPDEPGLDLALGVVHLSLLDVDAARTALQQAAKSQPDNLAVLSNLANACAKARDHAAARQYHQKLLDLGQDEAEYRLGLGAALLGLGDDEAAIRELRRAAEQNPKLAEAHFHLARAYRATGRVVEAQRELKTFQALKASPFQVFNERSELERSLWRRAEMLLTEGKEQEALKLLSASNAPGNQPPYLVGALYYKLGRPADAERLLGEALRLAPTQPKIRSYLGLALLEQGRLAEAEKLIGEDAAQNPREPFVLMAVGQLHFRKKEWADAVRYLQESRVVEPAVLLMLCEAQLESGLREQAQETAQLVATFASTNAEAMSAVARLLERHQLPPLPRPGGDGP